MTGILSTRAAWDVSTTDVPGQSRGMKVRSSVKKLCDGCKVRPRFLFVGGLRLEIGDDNGSWPLSVDAVMFCAAILDV